MKVRSYQIAIILMISISFLVSCGDGASSSTKKTTTPNAQSTAAALPTIPKEIFKNLWDNCTGIDFIFHELPFSMSQTEQASIRNNLTYFDNKPVAEFPVHCKPIGRIFFQAKGEVAHDIDLYYSDGCQYFVLMENERPKYANRMTPKGVEFFNNMLLNGLKTAKSGMGG